MKSSPAGKTHPYPCYKSISPLLRSALVMPLPAPSRSAAAPPPFAVPDVAHPQPSARKREACPIPASSRHPASLATSSGHPPRDHRLRVLSLPLGALCPGGGTADLLVLVDVRDGQKEGRGRAVNHESVRPLFSFAALNTWRGSWSTGWDWVCFLNHINKGCQLDVEGHFQQRLRDLGAQSY